MGSILQPDLLLQDKVMSCSNMTHCKTAACETTAQQTALVLPWLTHIYLMCDPWGEQGPWACAIPLFCCSLDLLEVAQSPNWGETTTGSATKSRETAWAGGQMQSRPKGSHRQEKEEHGNPWGNQERKRKENLSPELWRGFARQREKPGNCTAALYITAQTCHIVLTGWVQHLAAP